MILTARSAWLSPASAPQNALKLRNASVLAMLNHSGSRQSTSRRIGRIQTSAGSATSR